MVVLGMEAMQGGGAQDEQDAQPATLTKTALFNPRSSLHPLGNTKMVLC